MPEKSADHSTALEIAWSIAAAVRGRRAFRLGLQGLRRSAHAAQGRDGNPCHRPEVEVAVHTIPGGMTDDTLHVPIDQPVRMVINSVDVLHSLYIPNFRVKMDAVPGPLHRALVPGHQDRGVSGFLRRVLRHLALRHADASGRAPARWLREVAREPGHRNAQAAAGRARQAPVREAGLRHLPHASTAHRRSAPPGRACSARQEASPTAPRVTVDENYIRESIVDPNAKIVAGFAPSMPTYQGKLKDKELDGIIAYIKSLK